jgi:O-antigen/teichoic acid export membrane protein
LYRLIFSVVFNVYFIAFLKIGILGFILSSLISNFAIFLTISLFSVWQRRTRPNFALARSLLRFALPYIPAGMVEAILNNLGVMALTITGNFALVGLYSIGQKLASVTAIAYQPIGTAWLPQMYKISKQDDAPRIYARATTMILMLLGAIIVFLSVMAHEIVALIAPESYDGASIVILPVAIGYMIYALRSTIRIGITLGDRTSYIPGLSSIVLLLGFPITLLAAYKFGAVGAAVGVSGVMIATVLLTGHVSQRFYRVPYEWSRLMRLAAILLVCVTCGNLVPADLFVAKLAVLALYPLLVLLFGALTDDEKRRLLIGLRLRKD